MRISPALLLSTLLLASTGGAAGDTPAERWWAHMSFLADDKLEGRDTGSEGHRRAAEYVAAEFERAGLEPGGTSGFIQPVTLRSRRIVEEQSSLAVVRDGAVEPIVPGDEATIGMRVESAPRLEARVVFVGYGLTVPGLGHDDLAGLDLRGRLAMFVTGGPANTPGALLAHYQSNEERWKSLARAGVIGTLAIQNPKTVDIPWARSMLSRFQPSMTLDDPALDEAAGQRLAVTINPARAEKLFAGSGHTFADILALAERGGPLPRFPLPIAIRAAVKFETARLESQNVVGILRGVDPLLKNEFVVLSAHLDHVGMGRPIDNDRIYNGAMDNASGVATLLETAAAIQDAKKTFRRSIVFAAVTGEEKGLLGSKYLAAHPTVPSSGIVANLNTDMFLPLFPMRSVIVQGLEESDLADDLRKAAAPLGVDVLRDPEPERRAFTRSDQYSFIRRGIPALSMKIGFVKGSPEHDTVKRWRTERYHAPSDDLNQPIDLQAAADFNRLYLNVVEAVANRQGRPRWNADSFFRRFVR